MPALRSSGVVLAVLLAHAGLARAESPTIEHTAVKCLVAGKYRKMPARFAPPEVAQPRVYFRPEGVPSWYYVEMKPEATLGQVGVLPKPTKKLVGKHIEYYVEAASRDFDTGRTPEYDPVVVAKDADCQNEPLPALYSKNPPSAVFPTVPEGFTIGGGAGAGTVVAIVGGAAAVTAGAIALSKDDEPAPPIPGTLPPPVTSPPITVPPTTVNPSLPAVVACQADPRQGLAPLLVRFNAQAAGGNGTFDYAWTFGDGNSSNQVSPSHTYATPGVYEARVVATSADRTASCARTVTVLARAFRVDVNLPGAGTGRVVGNGIDCPGDCSEEYAPGTSVTLAAQATGGSTFAGWSGDCTGTGACNLIVDGNRSVNATFNAPPPSFALNVTVGGNGAGTVSGSGINCPGTCSQTFVSGTAVALTAAPAAGSTFGGWGGDCAGTTGLTCNLVMNGPHNVSATFGLPTTFRLTLNVLQDAAVVAGVEVTPSSFGFCDSSPRPGTTCVADYTPGTTVTLRPVDETGDHLAWTGDCASFQPGTSCVLNMTTDHSVGALFGFAATVAQAQSTLVSRLQAPSARVQATLSDRPLSPITNGVQALVVVVVDGDNRLEAQVIEGSKGTWALDLAGIAKLERGSLRVVAGDALAVTPDSVVFRLSGRAGERIAIAFTAR